jgi:fibronectin-binding autotransporter adhesin
MKYPRFIPASITLSALLFALPARAQQQTYHWGATNTGTETPTGATVTADLSGTRWTLNTYDGSVTGNSYVNSGVVFSNGMTNSVVFGGTAGTVQFDRVFSPPVSGQYLGDFAVTSANYVFEVTAANMRVWVNSFSGSGLSSSTFRPDASDRSLNIIAAPGSMADFSGTLADNGSSVLALTYGASGVDSTVRLSGTNNSYSGVTTLTGGQLDVSHLANGGENSSIGRSSSAATNLVLAGGGAVVTRLNFIGPADSTTDRLFTVTGGNGGSASLQNNGAGVVKFTNTGAPAYSSVNTTKILRLGGTNSGDNTLALTLANNGTGVLTLHKDDSGRWILTGTNTYTGSTTINGGVLEAVNGTGLSTNSMLSLAGGVLQSSGDFIRRIGGNAGNVNWGATSDGGFAAIGGVLNLQFTDNSNPQTMTWGNAAMVRNGQSLILGSTSSDNMVDWKTPISLGTAGTNTRTINAIKGTGAVAAQISGNITGNASQTLEKIGDGTLRLAGTNTYTGATVVTAGALLVNGINSGTGAVTVAAGATLGGSGTIAGATTINGIHSPGNSPGIQTFGDNLTYAGASPTVLWELTADTTTQGSPTPVFDQIIVGGNLDFSVPTTLTLSFDFTGSTVDWSNALWDSDITGTAGWLVYDVSGTLGNFNNLSLATANWADGQGDLFNTVRAGSTFSLYQDGNDIYLNYAVPEPSTYALLVLAAAGVGAHVIRRRRR